MFITVFAIVFVLAMIFEKPEDDDLEDEEFEDDEDEEDASPRPSLRDKLSAMKKEKNAAPRAVKKSRQAEYEEEYERYKAQRESRPKPAAQAPVQRAPQTDQSDPFAEWEKANAKAESQRSSSYAAKAMGADAPKYTPPVRRPLRSAVRQLRRRTLPVPPLSPRRAIRAPRRSLPRRHSRFSSLSGRAHLPSRNRRSRRTREEQHGL